MPRPTQGCRADDDDDDDSHKYTMQQELRPKHKKLHTEICTLIISNVPQSTKYIHYSVHMNTDNTCKMSAVTVLSVLTFFWMQIIVPNWQPINLNFKLGHQVRFGGASQENVGVTQHCNPTFG